MKIVTVRGSNPGGGEIFQCPFRPALSPTQPSFATGTVSFPAVKQPGRGAYNPLPSSAEVASPSVLSQPHLCACIGMLWGVTLIFSSVTLSNFTE